MAALLLCGFLLPAVEGEAGTQDSETRYFVKIEIGKFQDGALDISTPGQPDSAGFTVISFADAQKAGLLDEFGDPTKPPDGSKNVGTGPATVKAHVFNDVKIKITPLKFEGATGKANGDAREVTGQVVVPMRSFEQDGATDADKEKKQNSLPTKLGVNLVGAQIGGGKLDFIDTKNPNNPNKNDRSMGWTNPAPNTPNVQPQKVVPVTPPASGSPSGPKVDKDHFEFESGGAEFKTDAFMSTLPLTMVPTSLAGTMGLSTPFSLTLDAEMQQLLFAAGYLDFVPGLDPITFEFGFLDVVLDGLLIPGVATIVNPFFDSVVVGVNALVPTGFAGWFDNDASTFDLAMVPEPASLCVLLGGLLALGVARRTIA
ncbi:MAG: hypothetical protein HY246_22935 [Proteobacteria bacterium]|nr:hypothetical protein [Pseudomonadota bacterium]